jgi:opacity protein-like surface antigen
MLKMGLVFSIIFFGDCLSSFSQRNIETVEEKDKKSELYSNGGYGKYFSLDKETKTGQGGNVYFFQIQINYKKNYFTRLAFDQYSMAFTEKINKNGLKFSINDKIQTTNLGIDIGYTFPLSKKVSPYIYVGAGGANMQVPVLQYDSTIAMAGISLAKKPFLSLRGGAGCDYEFTKMFIAFLEMQYLSIPFKIGFKTLLNN